MNYLLIPLLLLSTLTYANDSVGYIKSTNYKQ